MDDIDSEVLYTEMDQHKLNLKIGKTNKIELNHGASTAQIQTIKMTANQTMTTWIPDKMAANQTRTAWLPDVNNEDRLSENPLKNTKGNYLLIIILYTKFIKIGSNTKYHNCGHIHRFAKYWGPSKKRYKILDRPWTVPRS